MNLKLSFLASSLVLMAPTLALSEAVTLNGVCFIGACTNADVLNVGQSVGNSLTTIYTFANGDQYYVTGFFGGSFYTGPNQGPDITADPSAQYIGNIGNRNAPSQAGDILTFYTYQNFNYTLGSADGFYAYYAVSDTVGPIASNSSYTVDDAWDGQWLSASTLGVGYSGTTGFGQAYLTNLQTDPLEAAEFVSLAFGAGSKVGATIFSDSTPEPRSILLLSIGGLGLIGLSLVRRRTAGQAKA